MPATTDRRRQFARIGLLLMAAILPGCARLQTMSPFRSTSAPSHDDPMMGSARYGDTYAGRIAQGTAPIGEGVVLASRADPKAKAKDKDPEIAADPAASPDLVEPLAVALQAPRLDEAATRQSGTVVTTPNPDAALKGLIAGSRKAIDAISNYRVQMERQERVSGGLQPAEQVILSLRRSPLGVRIEWPEGPNKGREALYAADPGDGLLHVKMPNSLVSRTALAPTNPLVLRSSRHPITEAGYDSIVAALETDLADAPRGRLRYRGLEQPDGVDHPCHKIERISPEGETWVVFLDPRSRLPVLVVGNAKNGDLLERYLFRDMKADLPELADASAFDADARWGPSRGLFGRMARSEDAGESPRR